MNKNNVSLVNWMGSDITVVNAARVSLGKEIDEITERDEKLIEYLARENHWTPFGHCTATFHIKAPLFVARQLGKHQVGLVWNEISRRYVKTDPEFFMPDVWRKAAENVKQGSSDEEVNLAECDGLDRKNLQEQLRYLLNDAEAVYKALLKSGVCPEQARMVLPQSMITEWYWTGSLAAFARICKLRLDPHSQRETQDIARAMAIELYRIFPLSWKALNA